MHELGTVKILSTIKPVGQSTAPPLTFLLMVILFLSVESYFIIEEENSFQAIFANVATEVATLAKIEKCTSDEK